MILPNGLLNPIAFSASFFCFIAYIARPTSKRTRTVHPTAIPIICLELIEVSPRSAETVIVQVSILLEVEL